MTTAADLTSRLHLLAAASRDRQLADKRRLGGSPAEACLAHAARSVPHYASLGKGRRLVRRRLPLVSRELLTERPSDFISTAFDGSELRWRTTSGTSGIPLGVPRDRASDYSFVYGTYRTLFTRVPELSSVGTCTGKIAVLQVNDNPTRAAAVAVNPSLDCALVCQVVIGRDVEADRRATRLLMAERPPLVTGRPRALLALAEMIASDAGSDSQRLASAVVCSGDNLHDDTRRFLERCFGAPVYNAYASREAGLVALECEAREGLHVVEPNASLEVLVDGEAEPTNTGTGELVVSSFDNWAMPILRYRTGDRATVVAESCSCGRTTERIVALSGRDSTYFTLRGRRFNPSILNETLESLPLRQFQLRQHADERFEFRWVPANGEDVPFDHVARTVSAALHALGPANVRVEAVGRLGVPGEKVQRFARDRSQTGSG